MLDTPCSEVVWRVLATHSIRQFPLHFPSRVSPCAITFQLESNSLLGTTSISLIFGTSLFYLIIIRPFQLARRFLFRETACFHHAITQSERFRYSGIQCHFTRWFVPDVSTQRAGLIFKGTKSNVQFFNEHSTLEDDINCCHETSGTNHLATQTYNPKERRP
jgi:hypothetical protein